MMLAAYQQNRVLIIVFITLGASLGALSICGYGVNHLDLGPQYASVIMGLDNTIATIPGEKIKIVARIVIDKKFQALFLHLLLVILFLIKRYECKILK